MLRSPRPRGAPSRGVPEPRGRGGARSRSSRLPPGREDAVRVIWGGYVYEVGLF